MPKGIKGFQKGHKVNLGIKFTKERREKVSKTFKDNYKTGKRVSWNKGKTGVFSKEALWKMGSSWRGKRANNWKGGERVNNDGYVIVYSPNHPLYHKNNKYILKHRLIMEKKLGRYLTKTEIVHHINEIRDDNRIDNLYLFKSISVHTDYHRNIVKTYKLLNKSK